MSNTLYPIEPIKYPPLDEPYKIDYCRDPNHDFPNMLYIAPGKKHVHKCPTCGQVSIGIGSTATL